jgi:glycerol-3-phosphate dehydrogenase
MKTRADRFREVSDSSLVWDVLVIGGGASGLGCAVEAASRGYRTLLVERTDFAKGTSSRSTKLAHGGVRYLEQFNLTLVLDALKERGRMLRNAPHLVHDLSFVVPAYDLKALPYYGLGLKVYEWMSGKLSLGASHLLSRAEAAPLLPEGARLGLRGGILYHDGQFDDARYAIALMRTLEDLGGTALNYCEVTSLIEDSGHIRGAHLRDRETGNELDVRAAVVINATGVHAEAILAMDGHPNKTLLSVSQGSHFVLPKDYLPGNTAMMIPKTSDGRVLFAIPWQGATLVGTTDEPVDSPSDEPRALPVERQFLLEHITKYFGRRPAENEIRSVWSGQRPLVREGRGKTSQLSRDHKVLLSPSGLVTITGGKWTTYRRMGEDTIDKAAESAGLAKQPSRTVSLHLHGYVAQPEPDASPWEQQYGADLAAVRALEQENPDWNELLHPALPYRAAEVVWAARSEMARTTEDVLARRTHALLLNARAAIAIAPRVSALLAAELGRTSEQQHADLSAFVANAEGYVYREA